MKTYLTIKTGRQEDKADEARQTRRRQTGEERQTKTEREDAEKPKLMTTDRGRFRTDVNRQ